MALESDTTSATPLIPAIPSSAADHPESFAQWLLTLRSAEDSHVRHSIEAIIGNDALDSQAKVSI